MKSLKKYSVGGKPLKKTTAKKPRLTNIDPATRPPAGQPPLSKADEEVAKFIDTVHVYLTQRGLPYVLTCQLPESKRSLNRFSFNHKHNEEAVTAQNAEWIFKQLGGMISSITGGFLRIIKFY